ncbi:MAG: DUF2330 domain-containing protein [Anaerolineae bacterium]|nr:DUF2330 domain-containing protein [Anaerolineae bacterium]
MSIPPDRPSLRASNPQFGRWALLRLARSGNVYGICCLALLLLFTGATPAHADGYIIPIEEPSSSVMADQKAVLVHRDGREELILSAGIVPGEAQDLAWIIPVPAVPEVQVAGEAVFEALDRISAPEIVYRAERRGGLPLPFGGLGAAAPPPAVEVIERRQVDVYDVAVLAAGDAAGLLAWLDAEGFVVPATLAPALDAYAAEGWSFVALRLAPGTHPGALTDARPVWLSFEAPEPVYPMRLTAAVDRPLSVRLYLLAEHRHELPGFEVEFAGWMDGGTEEALASLVDRQLFFTKLFDASVPPEEMDADFYPTQAGADDEFRQQQVYTYVSTGSSIGLAELSCLCGVCGGGLLFFAVLVVAAAWLVRHRQRT